MNAVAHHGRDAVAVDPMAGAKSIWARLSVPPVFANLALTRRAELLHTCLLAVTAVYLIGLLIGVPFIFIRKWEATVLILVVLLPMLLSWRYMHRGSIVAASEILVCSLWIVATVVVLGASPGVGFIMYVSPILIAAVLIGPKIGTATGIAGLSVCAFRVFASELGVNLPVLFPAPAASQLFLFVLQIILAIVPVYIVIRRLDMALNVADTELKDRKHAEQALRESEAKFSKAFRSSPLMVCISTLEDGQYIEVNDAFERLSGYGRAEIIGHTSIDLGHWANPADRNRLLGLLRWQDRVEKFETCFRRKSGEVIACELWAEFIEFSGKKCLLAVINDITERKRIDLALAQTFRRTARCTGVEFLRTLAKELACALDMKYSFISEIIPNNRGRARTLALCVDGAIVDDIEYDLAGTPCADVVDKTLCHYPRDLQRLFPQDHSLVDWQAESYLGTPIFSADGTLLGIVGLIDVKPMEQGTLAKFLLSVFTLRAATELERLRSDRRVDKLTQDLEQRVKMRTEELEISNREHEVFSYTVSHDLRAPLRGIAGFTNALLNDKYEQLDDDGRKWLGRIADMTQRMGSMIDDLLKMARISRRLTPAANVNLSAIANEAINGLAEESPQRQVKILIAPNVNVFADPGLMRIVFDNLLGNAWKFTGKVLAPLIEFGTAEIDGELAYYVRDNGAGFDMVRADKLFKAFERLHSDHDFPGTGIGLATVKRVVELHQGKIWVTSIVNGGTTVYFTLNARPISASQAP